MDTSCNNKQLNVSDAYRAEVVSAKVLNAVVSGKEYPYKSVNGDCSQESIDTINKKIDDDVRQSEEKTRAFVHTLVHGKAEKQKTKEDHGVFFYIIIVFAILAVIGFISEFFENRN